MVSPARGFKNGIIHPLDTLFMANGFQQYLKETQSELHHVAWPTRNQTIVYTALVALISVGAALYLGLFDSIFTNGLSHLVNLAPNTAPAAIEVSTSSFATSSTSTESSATATPATDTGIKLPNLGN